MLATMRSEQIKLTSTRGTWIALTLFVVLSLAFGFANVLVANNPTSGMTIDNSAAIAGVLGFGLTVLTAVGALAITSEYRYRTINTTFQATPSRSRVLTAKAAVLGLLAGPLGLATASVGIAFAEVFGKDEIKATLGFGSAGFALAATTVACIAAAIGALGVGAMLRSSAAALSVVIIWSSMGENMLRLLPKVGDVVGPLLPFGNVFYAITGEPAGISYHWGQGAALAYFVAVSLALFGAGVMVTNRRDA